MNDSPVSITVPPPLSTSLLAIEQAIAAVQQRIGAAARVAGRPSADVTLVGVSKTIPAPRVAAAVRAGIRELGENRVQEAAGKVPEVMALLSASSLAVPAPIWRLIGHLQTNKVRQAVALFDTIDSVDSVALAQVIDQHAAALHRWPRLLVQVNVMDEDTKSGFSIADLRAAAPSLAALSHVRWQGLMTIAPQDPDDAVVRQVFTSVHALLDELAPFFGDEWRSLSMGMSSDFATAIACGATHVRLGRALFGERLPRKELA